MLARNEILARNSSKKFLQKCLFKISLWPELITPNLTLQFLVKIWSENSIFIPRHSRITYFRIWPFGGAKYQGGDKAEARGTDEQPLSIKPPLIRCGETDRSNLKTQKFVLKRWQKNLFRICFLKLKAEEKANFSKIIGECVTFLWRI